MSKDKIPLFCIRNTTTIRIKRKILVLLHETGQQSDDIGSSGYMQSKCSPIFSSMLSNPLDSIVQTIASDLNNIASQIASDLDLGINSHFYMRDENGDAIRGAIQELERCNCSALSFYLCFGLSEQASHHLSI